MSLLGGAKEQTEWRRDGSKISVGILLWNNVMTEAPI